jgi:hypothetical protein
VIELLPFSVIAEIPYYPDGGGGQAQNRPEEHGDFPPFKTKTQDLQPLASTQCAPSTPQARAGELLKCIRARRCARPQAPTTLASSGPGPSGHGITSGAITAPRT